MSVGLSIHRPTGREPNWGGGGRVAKSPEGLSSASVRRRCGRRSTRSSVGHDHAPSAEGRTEEEVVVVVVVEGGCTRFHSSAAPPPPLKINQ